jgi:hypothetical protein
MPRNVITIGNDIPTPTSSNQIIKTVFLVDSGALGDTHEYDFLNDEISYFQKTIKQTFEYVLIDVTGENSVRISFNKPGMSLSSAVNGAKTLKSKDSLYIEDCVQQISIYYVGNSSVEMILMGK